MVCVGSSLEPASKRLSEVSCELINEVLEEFSPDVPGGWTGMVLIRLQAFNHEWWGFNAGLGKMVEFHPGCCGDITEEDDS